MNPFPSPAHEAAYLKTQWQKGIVPEANPVLADGNRHAVLLLHGFTSSPKDFGGLAARLHANGMTVYAPLLPGHGTSPFDLETVRHADWMACAQKSFDFLAKSHESVSVVGFSLGGALALHLAAQGNVARLALVAPWLKIYDEHFLSSEFLAFTLGRFTRWQRKETAGNINDPEGLKNHFAYYHFPLYAVREAIRMIWKTKAKVPLVCAPLLLVHSVGDRTADFCGSTWLYEHIGSTEKEFVKLCRSNHIVFRDYERNEAENRVTDFLAAKGS